MRSFRSISAYALGLVMALGVSTRAGAEAGKDDGGKQPEPQEKAGVAQERLDLPVPKGQPQKGIKIPIYGLDGVLRMNFKIGVATWIDDENIKMGELRVETFKEGGAKELDMDLPDAVLNTRTRDITAKAQVKIKRNDFEISGGTMTFNTETRQGTLGGGVRMLIYNVESSTGGKPAGSGKTRVELTPGKEKKK